MKNEISELSEAELDLVFGAEHYNRVVKVDLGNMLIQGYVGDEGSTMGVASSGNDARVHVG
jgi:hypothetical protein